MAGVLIYDVVLAAVFMSGTPLLVNYLIQLTRAQLYECEWWTNYRRLAALQRGLCGM